MRVRFEQYPTVIAGISERTDGSMIWGNRLPVTADIRQRRDRYFVREQIDPGRVVAGGVAHGTDVVAVNEQHVGQYIPNKDALITNTAGLYLAITVADCLPIYLFDPATRVIGIAHAGWRGTVAGILERVVETFGQEFGAHPRTIQTLIGPHIQSCHFEIKEDVATQLDPGSIEARDGRMFGNLAREAELRLYNAGCRTITIDERCTVCHADRFFSARHDRGTPLRGMVAYIGLQR
ncbi:polyphenol oxidase family protein [Candidatus Uhrbacteria bacterium]|nr:polyphenol oxidase family protein [Candidatus Uhrbacteria bacterium]